MTLLAALITLLLPVAQSQKPASPPENTGTYQKPAIVVTAPDSPVRLERATVVAVPQAPPVVLYSATNSTDNELEQFTVIAFVFDADGTLKARQTAPGRRTLEAHGSKYSTIILDGSEIAPTDTIVLGVNQAQRANPDSWWRTNDLQPLAVAAAPKQKK